MSPLRIVVYLDGRERSLEDVGDIPLVKLIGRKR
jgi:hypothetical protein